MGSFATQIDVRKYQPKDKHNMVFSTIESLKSGEKMELINDHDPKPLRYELMAEYKGQYEWEYIEEGPEVWRVSISKK